MTSTAAKRRRVHSFVHGVVQTPPSAHFLHFGDDSIRRHVDPERRRRHPLSHPEVRPPCHGGKELVPVVFSIGI
ncbi:hypothetical protein EJB05_22700, partial [Eragrostis curvula]